MVKMSVTCAGDAATRFDRDYYVARHLPLVIATWGPHELNTVAAFFPAGDGAGTIAICECKFRDEAAIGADGTSKVMADVQHFTNVEPAQSRAVSS